MTATPSVLSLSWIRYHGRSADIADRIGATAEFISVGRLGQRVAVLWRYPIQVALTIRTLLRHRPDALIVMAPPLPLVLLALAWGRLLTRPVVIDAHSAAVISPRTGRPRRRFAFVAKLADLVLVTRSELAVPLNGSVVLALDDPPVVVTDGAADRRRRDGLALRVVYPCSWYADEPVNDVLAAACLLPGIEIVLTGCPNRPITDLPGNVTLTGYLDRTSYWAMLRGADVVLALTTRDNTMQRAGYEALAAGVPLVVSDTQALRDWYSDAAVPAGHGPDALADAITSALTRRDELLSNGVALRARRTAEFARSLRTLQMALGLDAELPEQRRETVTPAVVLDDETVRVGSELVPAGLVGEQPGQRLGELVGGVGREVVQAGLRADTAHAEGRGHDRHSGTEGIEHLEPAAAATVDRHHHDGAGGPRRRKVVHETQRAHPLSLRRATASNDLQLDERGRAG